MANASKHYFSVDICFVPGNGLQDGQLEVWVTRNVFRRGQEDYPFDSWIISITNSVYCLGCVFLGHFSPLFRCLPCFCETILSGRTLLQTLVRSSFWPKAVTNKLPVPRAAPRSFETAPSQKVYFQGGLWLLFTIWIIWIGSMYINGIFTQ